MDEIEIKKDIKDFTPVISRGFAVLAVTIILAIKIADPSVEVDHVLIGVLGMSIFTELHFNMPTHLTKINISESVVEFVYAKNSSMRLVLSLVRNGDIQVSRSSITGCLKITSGLNSIKLPFPCGKDVERKVKEALTSIHNKSVNSQP